MSELDWRFNCSPEEIQVFGFRSENQKLVVMSCEADHSEYTHHDWLNSVRDDSADYPIVCDSYSESRQQRVVRAMPPSISALSPKEEENVKEVLGMRCRAACRPYLEGTVLEWSFSS